MEENKKVIQTLTDEELMDLVGGASFKDIINIIKKVVSTPPIRAVYAISPTTNRI